MISICFSAATLSAALPSWCRPINAFKTVRAPSTTSAVDQSWMRDHADHGRAERAPVASGPCTAAGTPSTPVPWPRRRACWSRTARGARSTSAVLRPTSGSTSSFRQVSSRVMAYHAPCVCGASVAVVVIYVPGPSTAKSRGLVGRVIDPGLRVRWSATTGWRSTTRRRVGSTVGGVARRRRSPDRPPTVHPPFTRGVRRTAIRLLPPSSGWGRTTQRIHTLTVTYQFEQSAVPGSQWRSEGHEMYNLRNRSFLKEIDFEPQELRFLLQLSAGAQDRQVLGYRDQAPGRQGDRAHLREDVDADAVGVRGRRRSIRAPT